MAVHRDRAIASLSVMLRKKQRTAALPKSKSFFCRSDLEELWDAEYCEAVFYELSEDQRAEILNKLMVFISFLLLIGTHSDWYAHCREHLFTSPGSISLKFTDEEGPRSQEELKALGLNDFQAEHWQRQYLFRPAKITFDTELWTQRINAVQPLPFEQPPNDFRSQHTSTYENSMTCDKDMVSVRLCSIPKEYITKGSAESWLPGGPLLRIVKSFRANLHALEEVKNMAFLKQSLTRHSSIAVHEAIIEQTSRTGSTISIILPYASLGDLAQFLLDQNSTTAEQRPAHTGLDNAILGQALIRQCAQLAGALKFLHGGFPTETENWKLCCAHLDLKPSNIIIFKPENGVNNPVGKWKLCDFGISVFQAEQNGLPKEMVSIGDFYLGVLDKTMQVRPTRIPGVYQAPEVEHQASLWNGELHTKNVGRSSDVWSFGAIFSEVLAYASGRSASVNEFRRLRTCKTPIYGKMVTNNFFYTSLGDEMVDPSSTLRCITRPEVADWLEAYCGEQQQMPASSVCFRCWATCIRNILKVSVAERPPTEDMVQWIDDLQTHGNTPGSPHIDFGLHSLRARDTLETIKHHSPFTKFPSLSTRQQSSAASIPWTNATTLNNVSASSDLHHLQLSSPFPDHAAISHHVDGSNIAYLRSDSVELYRLLPSTPIGLELYKKVPLRHVGCVWKGLHLSYPYLIIWGTSSGQPDLRVYDVSEHAGKYDDSLLNWKALGLPRFDYSKPVVISKLGYIATIWEDSINIISASDSNARYKAIIPMEHLDGKLSQFLTLNFDDSGEVLYAWGNRHIHGVLFAYVFANGITLHSPCIERKFEEDYSERRHKCLVPIPSQGDCVVVAGTELFLGCINEDRRQVMLMSTHCVENENEWVPQPTLMPENGSDPLAICAYGDSLITYQLIRQGTFRNRKAVQVCQRSLLVRRSIDLVPPDLLREWKPKQGLARSPINTDVKMTAVDIDEEPKKKLCLIIAHRSGVIEVVC
ncbi:hypothetical protein N0V93_002429 [Gnomoniopsis smithogilvyi]|uniref:Protein kinase domain-containing protein n=1 Tax=Gnomoniopsis smithogilvyi TaxID=1191159 RepID=A0A9W9CY61_9PEZI|nr:hypothetical protein N0V93_002429 [Gnomoniopsis smithogilvyi]